MFQSLTRPLTETKCSRVDFFLNMRAIFWAIVTVWAFAAVSGQKKIVCYYTNWSVFNADTGIDAIDPKLCTHLNYAFVTANAQGIIEHLDKNVDLGPNEGGRYDSIRKFNELRKRNPKLKTLISVGGGSEGSEKFSPMSSKPETRRAFVDNIVKFIKKYGFNGLDLDWEYPNQRGGVDADKQNYVLLLKELRERFDREGLLLTAAVVAIEVMAKQSYIISEVAKYLHFVNLMTYDIHGPWDKKTGINAPLYPASYEKDYERLLNVDSAVRYWLSQGAPANKLILGVPFYGQSYTLDDPNNRSVGAPANNPGTAGTRYSEICRAQKNGGWDVKFEEQQRVPYMVKGDQWVGYEDVKSLKEKIDYLKRLNLGGVMIWSIDQDDISGACGSKYPLLNTLNRAL